MIPFKVERGDKDPEIIVIDRIEGSTRSPSDIENLMKLSKSREMSLTPDPKSPRQFRNELQKQ
jgi:hypothetical protein